MPVNQPLMDGIVAGMGVVFVPGGSPRFAVNDRLLLAAVAATQALIPAKTSVEYTGTMSFPDGAGGTVTFNAVVQLGADGAPGAPDGQPALIMKPSVAGQILIAVGGRSMEVPAASGVSSGGPASVLCGDECLAVALGGRGGDIPLPPPAPVGMSGSGDGGDATVVGGASCVLVAIGGSGNTGCPPLGRIVAGATGSAGQRGGHGGTARATGRSDCWGETIGGGGGIGGPGGGGGPPSPGTVWTFTVLGTTHSVIIPFTGVAAGPPGNQGVGGNGGSAILTMGKNSTYSAGSGHGLGGAGLPAGRDGRYTDNSP